MQLHQVQPGGEAGSSQAGSSTQRRRSGGQSGGGRWVLSREVQDVSGCVAGAQCVLSHSGRLAVVAVCMAALALHHLWVLEGVHYLVLRRAQSCMPLFVCVVAVPCRPSSALTGDNSKYPGNRFRLVEYFIQNQTHEDGQRNMVQLQEWAPSWVPGVCVCFGGGRARCFVSACRAFAGPLCCVPRFHA